MKDFSRFLMSMVIAVASGCNHSEDGQIRGRRHEAQVNQFMRSTIKDNVDHEASGASPSGGVSSWNEKWTSQIRYLRKSDSDAQYIDYIIEERRRRGLPELTGL